MPGNRSIGDRRSIKNRRRDNAGYKDIDRRSAERRAYSPHDIRKISWGFVRASDFLAVVLTGMASYYARHSSFDLPQIYIVALAFTSVLTLNYMQFVGAYSNMQGGFGTYLWNIGKGWFWVVITVVLIAFFTKTSTNFSRVWVFLWLTSSFVTLGIIRIILLAKMKQWSETGVLTSNLVVVGTRDYCEELLARLQLGTDDNVNILGAFLIDDSGEMDAIGRVPVLGNMDQLATYFYHTTVQQVILAMPWQHQDLPAMLEQLKSHHCDVALSPGAFGFQFPDLGAMRMHDTTLIRVIERPISGWSSFIKYIEDRILGVLFLILALPVFGLIAVAIRLESTGPAFFRQKRLGFHNDEFSIYKFRSMRVENSAETTVKQATKDDPRITRVGKFLRRTSLDELPQLINVVKGEMSLVGPRPHAVDHNTQYSKIIDQYLGRHKVKPGITGWAQVNGFRGETDTLDKMQRRVQFDLNYIDNWSFILDMKIISMTFAVCFGGKNAY
mgnify:CR=1 FL=1